MKYVVTILIFLFSSLTFGQNQTVFNLKYSEPLAVFSFVERLSDKRPSHPFKQIFAKSKFNNEKNKKLISQFDSLQFDYSYQFEEFPFGSKTHGMTKALLKKNLIDSKSLNDFKLRSVGIIPNDGLNQLTSILAEFTPVYVELIFNPNREKFETQLANLKNLSSSKNIARFVEQGLIFYNSEWDKSVPFEIAFYPLPDSNGFTAEAFYNNAISAIPPDFEDSNLLLSVILHEIFHILFNEQSLRFKLEVDKYFRVNPSKYSIYAYWLLNEALATAFANGYVYEKLSGKLDTEDWYFLKYINLMAKKIYPIVVSYLSKNKSIDKEFVDAYIRIYEKNFPEWINEPEHTFTYRYVLSDDARDFDVINRLFPYRSASLEKTLRDTNLSEVKSSLLTKIFIVSKDNQTQLKLIKSKFSELKKWNYQSKKEFIFNTLLNNRTELYIINRLNSSTEKMLEKLKESSTEK